MNSQPLVSIVVPCYNQAQYLNESLDSVLKQTYSNWECIVVDDGSPDDTEAVVKVWCEKDRRFKYLHKENGGLADARNAGIKHSTGKFILPLDSDDKISTGFVEEAVYIFESEQDVKLVYPRVCFFEAKNGEWTELPLYSYDKFLWGNLIVCSSMYRREDFDKASGYNTNMKLGFEDWDFWLSILNAEDKVVKLKENFLYYRIKKESMSVELHKDNKNEELMYWQVFMNHLDVYTKQESYIRCVINLQNLNQEYQKLKNSRAYRLGMFLLKPFFVVKSLLKSFS